ncbi:hypothetical protein G6F70_005129 [Rhizopus microsporus]|nr:hypothetical protein G6F71_003262 [Rhizopus microsporus]KAG1199209.1 hypothetical protein G6F70_005129 [Rhizopus microsporus]KAG1211008.1 hypothetical protein G6F69_004969 [Rhizopus microsporus]KAG1232826.1 hypothetical protein G6F67_004725 [Rhizopus microsporus]KAG1264923.1 hypothetical protein G6F68_003988 [Rhizopus microsporus]
MPSKRPTPFSSIFKSKRQKTQDESSIEGISLKPDYMQDELWETLFNIKHEQSKRRKPNEEYNNAKIELDYGWKTDEYMVAVLFKRNTVERIPQNEEEMNLLKRRVNLTNWSKGIYPLKKEPTGLSMTDRIIGIDPGLCGIFVMVDGASEDVNNKKTVKERSVKFANNGIF